MVGLVPHPSQQQTTNKQKDVNKNNVITYTEFIAAVLEMHGKIEEYRFAEAFDQLDTDDSGYSTFLIDLLDLICVVAIVVVNDQRHDETYVNYH